MWDAIFGAVRWSTSAGRPAPLTGVNRPVARRWSCAGVDQRRPPAPIAQYGAAGLALVAAPDVQRSSQNWLVRWSCAGPPAQVHQRTEYFSGEFSKRPHFTYGLYIYANLILGHLQEFLFMLHT